MKISVIGFSGSGKTTLAAAISKKLNIPHLHIDRIWFEAGGHVAQTEEEKDRVRDVIKEHVLNFIEHPSWVTDGNYKRVQPYIIEKADKVIFLDISLSKRIWNHVKRVVLRSNRHPELTILQDLSHIKHMVKRTFADRDAINELCALAEQKLTIIRSEKESNELLKELG